MSTGPRIVRQYDWNALDDRKRRALLQRPALSPDARIAELTADIVQQVRAAGDAALREYTARFDGVEVQDLRVSAGEFDDAEKSLSTEAIAAIDAAIVNVRKFHEAQRPQPIDLETVPGVRCERVSRAIDAVGLYVPAGSAPLPSAAVMLAVPAAIAGCRRKVLCTPPRRDGSVDAAVLVAARHAGISDVYRVGGAQAIAALAYGTESIASVDKIFGPGNAWVTEAKNQVAADPGGAAIDMPAGPSEVLVIADESADATFVAADLLSQAEHGPDSQVILLTTSTALAAATGQALATQLATLERRDIAMQALAHSRVITCPDLATAVAISNAYAPEHLIIQTRDARSLLPGIINAGSVFLGPWTPESVGDYCSGTNHVLPTYGAARTFSGLGLEHFMRRMTVQELSRDGLEALAPTVTELASLEGLDAHARAVTLRLQSDAGNP